MTVRLVDATRADLDTISALAARTFPLACPPELATEEIGAFIAEHLSPEAFRAHLDAPGHDLLMAREAGGDIVGYVLLIAGTEMDATCADQLVHQPTVGISKFYVSPDHHGAGIASEMLAEVCRRSKASGAQSMWLATNVANARARRFYVKHGFVVRGHRIFDVGGVANTDVVYELTL
ncbi:GNAT family N-acetyltransferase [Dietzia sp. ANT_WB102]|uniref:GNAT family N-acetyltransferase n=1 Tax=Dietzia sp. ANT_WB102 TaxID=2597345 RepID=UPI0011EE63EC|nr:GNAT family N-acetyltransferase [Dietzia sp. ANT_WB102]KAA0919611.1 GNAT family N-acetyltransferase [Dietzia sp. ANT_WB102]